jgi:hypothetical protein
MASYKIEGRGDTRALWAKYREYLEQIGDEIRAGDELKPGSRAFVKLKELSNRLGELQEKDFEAKQLKMEIDRALAAASGGALGGLLKAFDLSSSKFDDDE